MECISSLVSVLRSEISLLKSEIGSLKSEIGLLRAEKISLKSANKFLEEENTKLKDKLGLTSKNSSIPSSKELYKLNRSKPKSTRNRGGQPGHPGPKRAKLVADEVVDLSISDSCSCGGSLCIASNPYIHQKIDLPEIKPHVIDYRVQHGRCRRCGKRYTASLPKGVTPDTFVPKVKSVIAALTGFYKNSKREVTYILKDIFNLDLSLGSISNSEARVAAKCQTAYQAVEETITQSKILPFSKITQIST